MDAYRVHLTMNGVDEGNFEEYTKRGKAGALGVNDTLICFKMIIANLFSYSRFTVCFINDLYFLTESDLTLPSDVKPSTRHFTNA